MCSLTSVLLHRFWHDSKVLENIKDWFEGDNDIVSVDYKDDCSNITVKRGDQTCKFQLKAYCVGNKLKKT